MKYLPSILVALTLSLGFGALVAGAAGDGSYVPLASLPLGEGGSVPATYNLSSYLSGMIKLIIAVGGALAILVAITGGVQYVASGALPDAKSGAKDRITNAFIGLALILSSYLILNTISPKLVDFHLLLPPVSPPNILLSALVTNADSLPESPASCGSITPKATLLNTPEALNLENGMSVIFTSSDPAIQSNLTKLKKEVDKLQLALSLRNPPATATVTSAYRPYVYQKHLYEIYTAWITKGLKDNADPKCARARVQISQEYSKHNLLGLVANPDAGTGSPHMKGLGVDINLSGISLQEINQFMVINGINLVWQNAPNDPVHFNLK